MNASSRYWLLCRLSLASNRGYERREIVLAKDFWQQTSKEHCDLPTALSLSPAQIETITHTLLTLFKTDSALAGLCLRCYVSYPILKACQKLAAAFSANYNFSYQDLLPFVLDDDGKQQIVLAEDGKTQLIVNQNGETQSTRYKFFTVNILASYKSDDSSMSLDNWTFLQTKQHPELKKFLAEFGFQHLSDWAMLNRIGIKQLSQLSPEDRHLIEVFHAVYRRDRRQSGLAKGKCPNPTDNQLKQMQDKLKSVGCVFPSIESILAALKRVASQLRQYDIWSHRESLEVYEPETGDYSLRKDLPLDNSNEAVASEEQELLGFIQNALNQALEGAIAKSLSAKVAKLNKSKTYRPFASKFMTGLQLYYCQGKSLKEIAPLLEFNSWDQARRVLNPGDLVNSVRTLTVQQLVEGILQKTKDLGLSDAPPGPDYLQNLSIQIEAFADQAVFQTAAAEIKAGKNRDFQSLYAEQVRLYCQKSTV